MAGGKGNNAAIGWFKCPEDPTNLNDWEWIPIDECGWIMSIFIRDMDNDDDSDILLSDRRGSKQGVRWLENPGPSQAAKKNWKSHMIGGQDKEVMFMDAVDFNQDGLEDVMVCERSSQTILLYKRMDKSGKRWEESAIDLPPHSGLAKSVRVGDVDLDGNPDIVHTANTMSKKRKQGRFMVFNGR